MKIALFGGTHGNEPVGIEVLKAFQETLKNFHNPFKGFWSSPKAYAQQKRYIDCDLNRAFGANGTRVGHESERSLELEAQVRGKFDFSIDLHTTTSNMGSTVILNNTHRHSQESAAYLKSKTPDLKIIEEIELDDQCTHLNRLCPAGLTIELGPVANNVLDASIIFKMHQLVELLLNFDFETGHSTAETEYFKTLGRVQFPQESGWYLHPNLDRHDFSPLSPGAPQFVNIKNEVIPYSGDKTVYPFFINEAAYLEHRSAFLYAEKRVGLKPKIDKENFE